MHRSEMLFWRWVDYEFECHGTLWGEEYYAKHPDSIKPLHPGGLFYLSVEGEDFVCDASLCVNDRGFFIGFTQKRVDNPLPEDTINMTFKELELIGFSTLIDRCYEISERVLSYPKKINMKITSA